MPGKIRVGILFGGRSAEHEVSLQSAKNIIDAIDRNKYEVVLIGIDKKGQWHLNEESRFLLPTTESKLPELPESRREPGVGSWEAGPTASSAFRGAETWLFGCDFSCASWAVW